MFVYAGDSDTKHIQSENLYLRNGCPSCHGFFGQGTATGPRLRGQREAYLLRRLKALQEGITRKPNGAIMISFARSLDANQTRDMAHYLSTMEQKNQNTDYIDYGEHADGDS
jgi:cytochrome c553